jgi:alkanesulfonate monooxygenase SsuD/methylene tetrahydromethanopterin reductase-like flavin-dependent oxidoreductase (luciferase family)
MLEACKEVGRDPTTLELTAGTFARVLAPGEQRPDDIKSMCGEPEEVAEAILGFERIGVKHLVVIVSPEDIHGVERFGKVIEALRKA